MEKKVLKIKENKKTHFIMLLTQSISERKRQDENTDEGTNNEIKRCVVVDVQTSSAMNERKGKICVCVFVLA